MANAPDWAAQLGDRYDQFRADLVTTLGTLGITVDEAHIDHGVLHTTDAGTIGLTNLVRMCHASAPERWPAVIAEHLRRCVAKPVAMSFELAGPRLRLRIVPDRLVRAKPDAYIVRPLAAELSLALAIDNPEHVVFVQARELEAWSTSEDELFALATANTRGEGALERQDIDIPDGPTITILMGGSYFAASHVLFLDRYMAPAKHGYLVGLPDRHALAVMPIDDGRCLAGLGGLVNLCHARFSEEPGAITDQLFWKDGDTLTKIACGVRDDGTAWVAPPDSFNDLVSRL
jgi:hypothetical protein